MVTKWGNTSAETVGWARYIHVFHTSAAFQTGPSLDHYLTQWISAGQHVDPPAVEARYAEATMPCKDQGGHRPTGLLDCYRSVHRSPNWGGCRPREGTGRPLLPWCRGHGNYGKERMATECLVSQWHWRLSPTTCPNKRSCKWYKYD